MASYRERLRACERQRDEARAECDRLRQQLDVANGEAAEWQHQAHWERDRHREAEAENKALVEALVVLYRTEARAEVARLCDESIDPSGALLGRIRRAAFSSTEGAGDG